MHPPRLRTGLSMLASFSSPWIPSLWKASYSFHLAHRPCSSQAASLSPFITRFRRCLLSFAVFLSSSPDFYAFLPCAVEESPHHLGSSALSGFPVFSFHLSASRASSQVRIRPAVKKEGLGHLRVLCADNRLKTFEIWSIRDRGRISEKSAYHPMLIYPFIQCSWILTSLYK